MADNEEGGETISHAYEWVVSKTVENEEEREARLRGNDWEVVSLTASTYAAAPGPRGDESIHEDSNSTVCGNNEAETSQALFMSGHFAFPPSQHVNLPIVPEKIEIPKSVEEDDLVAEMKVLKEEKFEKKDDEKWGIEGLDVTEEFQYSQLFEKKSHMTLPTHGLEFNEPITQRGLNVDKEQDLYGATKLGSFYRAKLIGNSAAYDGSAIVNDLVEASVDAIDPSYLISQAPTFLNGDAQAPKFVNRDEADDSELPCGAWWKGGVASLYTKAAETSAFWSIFVAAAVMGLIVLGQ